MLDDEHMVQALRRFTMAYARPCKINAHNPSVFLNTGERLGTYVFGSSTGKFNDVVIFYILEAGQRPLIFGVKGARWRFLLMNGSSFFALELVSFQDNKLTLKKVREFNVLPIN